MKLTMSQVVLEEVRFGHVGDFLAQPPSSPAEKPPVQIAIDLMRAAEDAHKVAVRVRATSQGTGDTAYAFHVSYIVLLTYEENGEIMAPDDATRRLQVTGATMLFPYLRELVSNLTARGRFGPVWLGPINFNEMILVDQPERSEPSP